MTENDQISYRKASLDDGEDIVAIMKEVAPEIPAQINDEAAQERLEATIIVCCQGGDSLVAVDNEGNVVGFVLAQPSPLERLHKRNNALNLSYIGVSKKARRRGIFKSLMAEMTAKKMPLHASVLNDNKSTMAERLIEMGFAEVQKSPTQIDLTWQPPKSAEPSG